MLIKMQSRTRSNYSIQQSSISIQKSRDRVAPDVAQSRATVEWVHQRAGNWRGGGHWWNEVLRVTFTPSRCAFGARLFGGVDVSVDEGDRSGRTAGQEGGGADSQPRGC